MTAAAIAVPMIGSVDSTAAASRLPESDDIDDLFVDVAQLRLEKTGAARVCLRLETAEGDVTEIDFWTSRKGRLQVSVEANEQARVALGLVLHEADGDVVRLEAASCSCHAERMTRGLCWIGFDVGDLPTVHVNLASRGHVKARRRG